MSNETNFPIPPQPSVELHKLPPFPRFCCTIGMIPSSYKVAMSYEEQLMWLCKFLEETVIPTINENTDATNSVILKYNEIVDFLNHYFDNLDVQQEINNKLDEMAENGYFEEILRAYVDNSFIQYFDNVASLRLASLNAGQIVATKGYYTPNDGGMSKYIVLDDNSLIDDGGSIINLANGLKAKLVINGIINIKQFGAKGDGYSDDTQPFQNAINYNYNLNTSFKIFVPEGIYVLSTLNVRKNTKLSGISWGSTFLKIADNVNENFIKITESDAYFITLENFTIIGNKDNNTCPNAIYIKRDSITGDPIEFPREARDLWLTIQNVRITRVFGNGIGTGSSHNNFRESRFNNIDINNCDGYGLYLAGTDNNYFEITSWGNKLDGFKIFGSAERYIACKAFANGDSENPSSGFDVVGSGFQFAECEAQENYGHGFNLRGTPNSNYIIRSDANGKIDYDSGEYHYAGVNFTGNNTRINMFAQCYDFLKGTTNKSSQGYGAIFNDIQQCNINISSYYQAVADYLVNTDYILNNVTNVININGKIISNINASKFNLVSSNNTNESIRFGGRSTSGGKQYDLFRNINTGDFRIDTYFNNAYISNPFFISYSEANNNNSIKLGASADKIGFFGKTGSTIQTASDNATDLSSAITLLNNLKTILQNYGLIN